MIPVILKDDFASDATLVRKGVIEGEFSTLMGPDGAQYTGISKYPVPHWYEAISEVVQCRIAPKLSCFRLNLKGEMPHSWVHSDDICAQYASVLYLNEPQQCFGGTSFWRHKIKGIESLPSREELAAYGIDSNKYYNSMDNEWKDLSLWEQVEHVSMRWNRFITYPTCFFHSRFPFEGFGAGPSDGRLIWICFYDKVGAA